MRKYHFCCLFLLLNILGGCNFPVKPGAQVWTFIMSSDNPPVWDTLLNRASYLDLRSDGRFTQDLGQFEYGSWELKDQRLYLSDQHHRTYVYRIPYLHNKLLFLQLGTGDQIGQFRGRGIPPRSPEKDPYSIENNQWRMPPSHKESDEELRKRLQDHCRFWEVYFTWAQDEGIGAVNTKGVPSPLKIYGNGFGLKHYDDLPSEWRACFFDEADCHRADSIIKHAFRQHNIVWPDTDDDLKKIISGCHQVQQWLQ